MMEMFLRVLLRRMEGFKRGACVCSSIAPRQSGGYDWSETWSPL